MLPGTSEKKPVAARRRNLQKENKEENRK